MKNIPGISYHEGISILEFKRLLTELREHRADIGVRFRLLGQMWFPTFLKVFTITENGAVLFDDKTKEAEIIPNLSQVLQFEIDTRFQAFQPNHHYCVEFNSVISADQSAD